MAIAKWIFGAVGWALGGPIGAVIGFSFGSMFDRGKIKQFSNKQLPPFDQAHRQGRRTQSQRKSQTQSGDFMISLIMLSTVVMRSDKKVTSSEKKYVQQFLKKQFSQAQATQGLQLINRVLKQKFSTREVCFQIKTYMDHSSRLQLIQYLFGVAKADGYVDDVEIEVIEQMSGYLGINKRDYESIKSMFYDKRSSAYEVLEVAPTASINEIKKAYRSLVKKYHPDKVKHLGEEHQKAAKEKFHKLQEAYELVEKERGIK